LYDNLLKNQEWMDDIRAADAILVSTHSQGSVVSTHLLDRLISEKHIRTTRNGGVMGPTGSFPPASGTNTAPAPRPQKICCLSMCGIHLGPLRYLSTTSLFQPYFQVSFGRIFLVLSPAYVFAVHRVTSCSRTFRVSGTDAFVFSVWLTLLTCCVTEY